MDITTKLVLKRNSKGFNNNSTNNRNTRNSQGFNNNSTNNRNSRNSSKYKNNSNNCQLIQMIILNVHKDIDVI